MKSTALSCLVVGLLVVACSGRGDEPRDPGRPAVSSGPKCFVTLKGADIDELPQCTAIATISEGAAHLYLELYPDREPLNVQRYASLVLNTNEWRTGNHKEAVGGRIEMRLDDGRRYRLAAEMDAPMPISLDVDEVDGADDGSHSYLRGELNANLPRVSAGPADYVAFRVVIN